MRVVCGLGAGLVAQLLLAANLWAVPDAALAASPGGAGITSPVVLPPFDPNAPVCALPPREKSIAFVQDNRRAFIEGAGQGIAAAARARSLSYQNFSADNDAVEQAARIEQLRHDGIGAVIVPPVDSVSLAPVLQRLINDGGYVGTIVPPPATTILNAPQYLTGKALGDAAAAYIRDKLHGKANVVLLTQDSLQFLTPRFRAIRDALQDMPGVSIVADISPNPVNEDGGYATMKLVLEAHPDVDVVLGADTVVLGALKALREAGKARPEQYFGGIDGEPDAIAEIKAGDGPYKASIALSSPVFGYALGYEAADWLAGRSVPQAIDALPIALTKDNLPIYEADQADPGAVFADPQRRGKYLKMYGNICYETRDQYLNFPWSSEEK
jgi:ribose transport system substrate-binding protein